ncbi:fructosamine kinase family protein [Halobacillus shinanisalinarum]|uniref:Fructosamine kinase family protein n=1 Tax=Halobacillus shinanisalinarum TaxID=2932258 RepID=A0ABY4H558_9BACI|nr:fructosamine kinase family protein [Halobacillus shinanisalinarum]UOQ95045.1 fructosamine kinase family protein [Halobacillus shinanisalinarum]
MKRLIQRELEQLNDPGPIKVMRSVSGGDINEAYYIRTNLNEYFIKINTHVPSNFFKVEALGLERIEQTYTINVPKVYHYNEPYEEETGILVMEWIEENRQAHSAEMLGQNLANMHKHPAKQFGLDQPTFIGRLTQANSWSGSWVKYYKEDRLQPQIQLAIENSPLPHRRIDKLERLTDQLGQWITHHPKPSLLHGDLWGGNYMVGPKGVPYLIDPSILYGDHAFELAFTELFGGFPPTFYVAYQEVMPLPLEYEDIKPLYQLYYLLVHLNMFGENFGPPVDRILARYVGE